MNDFLKNIENGPAKLGLWQSLATPYTAEICATAGYDWLLFDGEHSPNTLQTLLGQLQAISAYDVEAIARVPIGEAWVMKQYLDLGFQTLLIPMVESAKQAEELVSASRFPPLGVRGVASATSRASGFGKDTSYLAEAQNRTGLIMQIESKQGLAAIEEIAAVDGVDALFIGPADLAGSLGHLGNPRAEEVQNAIDDAISRIQAAGKPVGIFAISPDDAKKRIDQGVSFVSLGTDIGILSDGCAKLRAEITG